jgi:hypothetical protein
MKRTLGMGLVGLALCLPGCMERRMPEPVRSNYDQYGAAYRGSQYSRIFDEDKDGKADIIAELNEAKFIAEGHKSERFFTDNAIVMTPQLRDAATRELHAERDMLYLMDIAVYNKHQGGK